MSKRNAAWVRREYGEDKWPSVLDKIEALIDSGESSLARVLTRMLQDMAGRASSRFMTVMIKGRPIKLPMSFAYGGNQSYISARLGSLCGPNTTTIVELGSGYGRNLFWLWLQGGPKDAEYLACEFTEAGRRCTERLAGLAPEMRVLALPYDFNEPDYESLSKGTGDLVVFTCHSFEQISQAKPIVFERLLALDRPVRGIHFEPIGWQIRAAKGIEGLSGSSADHADTHDYNRNLWAVLTDLDRAGAIVIEDVEPELMCINPLNGTSVVQWRSP
jgi:hypothetical protein